MENKAYMQEPPTVDNTAQPVGTGQQPYGQPGYGQPGYGQPGYGQPPQTVVVTQPMATVAVVSRPPNYFALSLFSCLFCFWPSGLLAIYYSSKSNSLAARGDIAGAEGASKTAKTLSFVSIGIGLVGILVVIILAATGNFVRHYSYTLRY